jgi:hypothetical protein
MYQYEYTKVWSESLKERVSLEDLGVDVRIILKLILQKWDWRIWTGLIWSKNQWQACVIVLMKRAGKRQEIS